MNSHEPIGYLASALVLTTFCMRRMVLLRAVAIASNLAFISYGALADIAPVLLLHALLLPTNIYRLMQAIRDEHAQRAQQAQRSNKPQEHSHISFLSAVSFGSNESPGKTTASLPS